MAIFASRSGAGMTATSPQTMSFFQAGAWMTVTWDRSLPGGSRPFSLSMMPRMYREESSRPFIRKSASPARTLAMARDRALALSGSWRISKIFGSILASSATFLMAFSSPVRVAWTSFSLTARPTASMVWGSSATATASRLVALPFTRSTIWSSLVIMMAPFGSARIMTDKCGPRPRPGGRAGRPRLARPSRSPRGRRRRARAIGRGP